MTILTDDQQRRIVDIDPKFIDPFVSSTISSKDGKRILSYGASSFGYDARLAREIHVFYAGGGVADPLNFTPEGVLREVDLEDHPDYYLMQPKEYVLGTTMETFSIPEDVMTLCIGKSTYARCGIFINVTPIEPGFKGQVTLEIYNSLPVPAKLYLEQGICQFVFLKGSERPKVTYSDRHGKYQNQSGITHSRS